MAGRPIPVVLPDVFDPTTPITDWLPPNPPAEDTNRPVAASPPGRLSTYNNGHGSRPGDPTESDSAPA